jgi:hypothetical protein
MLRVILFEKIYCTFQLLNKEVIVTNRFFRRRRREKIFKAKFQHILTNRMFEEYLVFI